MPPSIFRIDPLKHLPLAKEFRENPVGHHSANLQCILNLFRGEPLEGKYILEVGLLPTMSLRKTQ